MTVKVVVNRPASTHILWELAAWLPEFAARIKRIRRRLWDSLPVIRNHVYHPAFAGSYSLKAVLPALVPETTYQNMAVANGQDAGLAWESLVHGNLDEAERERVRKALLAALWFFMIRQMQTGGNKAFSFGKSRARLVSMQQKKVTFRVSSTRLPG